LGDVWVIIRSDHLEIGRFELLKIAEHEHVNCKDKGESPVNAKIVMNDELVQ
jgi:hypothetical protein